MLPVFTPGISLAGEQATLKTGSHRGDAVGLEEPLQIAGAVGLEIGLRMAEPEVNGVAVAGGVVLENRLDAAVERADG